MGTAFEAENRDEAGCDVFLRVGHDDHAEVLPVPVLLHILPAGPENLADFDV